MIARPLSLALFVTAGAIASAQSVNTDAIAAFVNAERERQHIPGIAVAVVQNGKPIFTKGYGKANLERDRTVTPATVFNIGSVSKQFLAAAVLKLQDQGRLKLDDELTKFFPDAPEAWKKITVRHLVTHTSGLPRELTGWNPIVPYKEEDWRKLAYATKPVAEPGAQWAYSNAGYFILAMTITKAAGRAWGEYVEEELFKPLGMRSTRVAVPSLVFPNRAEGYIWNGGKWQDDGPLNSVRPSGAFVSTLADLVKWEQALTQRKFLKPASFDAFAQPSRLADGRIWPYGLGWYLDGYGPHRVVHHAGGIVGYRAEFMRFVDKGLTVILLTNIGTLQTEPIAQGIARRALPELILTRGKPRRDPKPALTGRIQTVLIRIANQGDIPEESVTPPLKRALGGFPAPMRAELKAEIEKAKALVFLREDSAPKVGMARQGQSIAKTRFYRLGSLYVTAYFSPEDRLAFFETSNEQP
jgi:CubicO group peptidase (beta-lactamase class C family)